MTIIPLQFLTLTQLHVLNLMIFMSERERSKIERLLYTKQKMDEGACENLIRTQQTGGRPSQVLVSSHSS